MSEKNIVQLKNISVSFDGEQVLKNFSVAIRDKEFVTLLGPSGCGKTTTLRIIAGFVEPDSGEILFDGKKINGVPAYKRQVNTIFQRYALFPNMNVYDNIAFGLSVKKVPKKEIKERVTDMLRLVNLTGYEKRDVNSLSGGQQQRLCIARALAVEPEVLLMDEPASALDPIATEKLEHGMEELKKDLCIIIVTHNMQQAMRISDNTAFFYMGELVEHGPTKKIFSNATEEKTRQYVSGSFG